MRAGTDGRGAFADIAGISCRWFVFAGLRLGFKANQNHVVNRLAAAKGIDGIPGAGHRRIQRHVSGQRTRKSIKSGALV